MIKAIVMNHHFYIFILITFGISNTYVEKKIAHAKERSMKMTNILRSKHVGTLINKF